MDAITEYLIKSMVWLTGFALFYLVFLRNERFFTLNRAFLVTGIIASICFPWFNFHYTVLLPMVPINESSEPQLAAIGVAQDQQITQDLLFYGYLSGIIYLFFRLLKQTISVTGVIRKSGISSYNNVRLVRTDRYPTPFSFFSFVFVNPSINDTETNEIVHHEQEHIRQRHWIDLLLSEALCILQWFNPVVWLYGRFIRQNHEYLADEFALKRTDNPAAYRAALLNQMFGGPVIQLANSFNYSLNKKRFTMMKQTISSPIRKLRLLLVLPLIAGVFYAFATPEYQFIEQENPESVLIQSEKLIKGKVTDESGNPLKGASVVISGKPIGTVTDNNGVFMLKVTDDSPIVVSYVGFGTQKVVPDFEKEMTIRLKSEVVKIGIRDNSSKITEPSNLSDNVLVVIDGKKSSKAQLKAINPGSIESVSVLKDKSAADLYGEKGKKGVIVVKLKEEKTGTGNATSDAVVIGYGKMQKENSPEQSNSGFRIRSAGTENKPLIVIDGIITENQDVNTIPPENIESVSVLKGESATILYGEKGKNGVILIKVKKEANSKTNTPTDVKVTGYDKNQKGTAPKGVIIEKRNWNGSEYYFDKVRPLIVKDGIISESLKMDDIDPNTIESIKVLKDEMAITKYGDKGKNGVLEIAMKKQGDVFTVVEEMPQFPGGTEALKTFVYSMMKYPVIALENGIEGQVTVKFIINKAGSVTNTKIRWGVDPALDKEALRIVESMPKWSPGKQNGEAVDVAYEMPINFKLPANRPSSQKLIKITKTQSTYTKQRNDQKDATHQLIIVPNPTEGKATVTLKEAVESKKLEIKIFDNQGKLLKKESKKGPSFSLSFTNMVSGTYLIVANDGTNQYSGQLIVNH